MKTEIFLTEQGRAGEALREVEGRYKRLLSAITDYIYTVEVQDGHSLHTHHGPGCEAVTGFSPAEFAADPSLWSRLIYKEDQAAVLAQTERILRGENPGPLEHRIVCRNGAVRWIRNTPIPHRTPSGRLTAYDGLVSDITERKLAEEALRQSEERLSLVIQGSNDGIWDWDLRTNKAYFSPRWKSMLGYADREIENTYAAWENLIHPEDRERARTLLQAYFAGETPIFKLEHRLQHKDGTYRWILARGVVLRNTRGKPVRMAGSHVDLTSFKRAEERLRQVNLELRETQNHLVQAARFESIGTLAAGVAHEVKNPLQTMLMGLHYLGQRLPADEPELTATLKDMREAVMRANQIISELLTLSKVNEFTMQRHNLNNILPNCLRLMRSQLELAGVDVEVRLERDLPYIQLDPARMEQVFLNLFVNAIQAMPTGGKLLVSTRSIVLADQSRPVDPLFRKFEPGTKIVIVEVRDTGTGIKEADLPRIFDPFFTTKPVGVGTGLGLSTARMVVDRHGGVIAIRNAPRCGVIVTIALPATL